MCETYKQISRDCIARLKIPCLGCEGQCPMWLATLTEEKNAE